jgi:hypothetical protein
MAAVLLSNSDRVAVVDDCDVAEVSHYRWRLVRVTGGREYVRAWDSARRRPVYLHPVVLYGPLLAMLFDRAPQIDHADRDGLNCRRTNLRACDHRDNARNSMGQPGRRKSEFKGVSFIGSGSNRGKWRATISLPGRRQIHLGYFRDEESAARTYDRAAREYFGQFARMNLPAAAA